MIIKKKFKKNIFEKNICCFKVKKKSILSKTKQEKVKDNNLIKNKSDWQKKALVNKKQYEKKYNDSVKHNEDFWKKEGKRINWIKPYTKIKDVKYSKTDVNIKWYYDGTLNASANCIDRHLKKNKDKTAIIWVGDDPKVQKKLLINNCIKKFLKQLTL